jgi:hypothetical protein
MIDSIKKIGRRNLIIAVIVILLLGLWGLNTCGRSTSKETEIAGVKTTLVSGEAAKADIKSVTKIVKTKSAK